MNNDKYLRSLYKFMRVTSTTPVFICTLYIYTKPKRKLSFSARACGKMNNFLLNFQQEKKNVFQSGRTSSPARASQAKTIYYLSSFFFLVNKTFSRSKTIRFSFTFCNMRGTCSSFFVFGSHLNISYIINKYIYGRILRVVHQKVQCARV